LKIVQPILVIENTLHLKIFLIEKILGFEDFENNLPSLYIKKILFEKN